jgi:hypothetical protein
MDGCRGAGRERCAIVCGKKEKEWKVPSELAGGPGGERARARQNNERISKLGLGVAGRCC